MAWCATRSFYLPAMDTAALWNRAPFAAGISFVSVAGTFLWRSSSSSSKRFVPFACLGIFTESPITELVHNGMLCVPIGYTFGAGMFDLESLKGGSPYGAGVFAGDGTRQATQTELALAEHQGKYMATTVKRLYQNS